MDYPTRDIVSPCLIIIPILLRRQRFNTLLHAIPLRIRPRTPLLRAPTQLLDRLLCDLGIVYVDPQASYNPIIEIWDPGVVFQHRAALVKFPECDLESRLALIT
jgi:hypothetical protein